MSEHSPLPWSADTTEPGELWIADSRRLSPVCMITGSGNVTERDRADAAFIVKAVNNHDALVRALRESAADIVCCCKDPDDPYVAEVLRRIADVLASVGNAVKP